MLAWIKQQIIPTSGSNMGVIYYMLVMEIRQQIGFVFIKHDCHNSFRQHFTNLYHLKINDWLIMTTPKLPLYDTSQTILIYHKWSWWNLFTMDLTLNWTPLLKLKRQLLLCITQKKSNFHRCSRIKPKPYKILKPYNGKRRVRQEKGYTPNNTGIWSPCWPGRLICELPSNIRHICGQ